MLSKILKNLQTADDKKSDKTSQPFQNKYQQAKQMQGKNGFHAKKSSATGAERQRRVGNRNNKPAR